MLKKNAAFCCIWTGEKYAFQYVSRLFHSLRRNCSADLPFFCLAGDANPPAEVEDGIHIIKLPSDLPGWWNKIFLFDQAVLDYRHLVFFDLDIVILQNIDSLLDQIGEAALLYAADLCDPINSSLMIIDRESEVASRIVQGFSPDSWMHKARHCNASRHVHSIGGIVLLGPEEQDLGAGDQAYLSQFVGSGSDTRMLEARICYSYKYLIDYQDWRGRASNPEFNNIPLESILTLNFHGYPKPHQIAAEPEKWPFADLILHNWR